MLDVCLLVLLLSVFCSDRFNCDYSCLLSLLNCLDGVVVVLMSVNHLCRVSYERDTKIVNAASFTIEREDHTIGNIVRM